MASLRRPEADSLLDLLCIGFGPASLAVAVALHDAVASPTAPPGLQHLRYQTPKVAFLERQEQFRWHAGMLLPGSRMQISFIKDLATLRDPRSEFTFLNYLHKSRRLVPFTNLGTFFPLRAEYEDYMRWCAGKFEHLVHYGQNVYEISPAHFRQDAPAVEAFVVRSRDIKTNRLFTWKARHVVVAVGGSPRVPAPFPPAHPRVVHSSQYLHVIPKLLQDRDARHRVAVIGGGQSAAEIFHDLRSRFPNSKAWLVIAGAALKPSDDSPFVNEIFDPDRVDDIYNQPSSIRAASILSAKDTNYGVVRLELLEQIYAHMYEQRLHHADEREWSHRILPNRRVTSIESSSNSKQLRLFLKQFVYGHRVEEPTDEYLDVDVAIVATGYSRDMHEEMLRPARHLMPGGDGPGQRWTVGRDYRVKMDPRKVHASAGVWLQGCNESTHGLSDTLLSILATRGAEIVESIFGRKDREKDVDVWMNGSDHPIDAPLASTPASTGRQNGYHNPHLLLEKAHSPCHRRAGLSNGVNGTQHGTENGSVI